MLKLFRKKKTEVETEYEKERRLICENYFDRKDLIKWETDNLPPSTLEALDDCGLITFNDTVVYLPPGTITEV